MRVEYQIEIAYADGKNSKHLSFKYDNADLRNEVYQSVCSTFAKDQVDMAHLVKNGGLTVSTYTYKEPGANEVAQIVPNTSFKIEVLKEILKIVKEKSL